MDIALGHRHIGKRLEQLIERQGMTKTLFAQKLGIHKQQVTRMVSSKDIKLHQLQQCCDVLGIDIMEFLEGA